MKTLEQLISERAEFAPDAGGYLRTNGSDVKIVFPSVGSDYPAFTLRVAGNSVNLSDVARPDPAEAVRRAAALEEVPPGDNLPPNSFALAAARNAAEG